MDFQSILFKNTDDHLHDMKIEEKAPGFFPDLNLDQIIDAITIKKEAYNLKPFFYTKLDNISAIKYRQEVMTDLENPLLYALIETFAEQMRKMYVMLSDAKDSSYKYEKERLFLDAASIYVKAIMVLKNQFSDVDLKSGGLLELQEFLTDYTNSSVFRSLSEETENLIAELDEVTYCIHIKGLRIEVRPIDDESDYSKEVENTFEKFKREPVKDYRIEFEPDKGVNQVQASILEGVAQLFPEVFHHGGQVQNLEDYAKDHENFLNQTIERFDREIQFYVAYLDYISGVYDKNPF